MITPGKLKPAAWNLNSVARPGVLIPKHAAWVCFSRFGVPWNALAVLLILHCALWVTPSLAAEAKDASEVHSLNRQVVDLYQEGKYQEAIPIARQLLEIRDRVNGPDHPDYATSLNSLAALYRAMGDYAKAEPLLRRRWRSVTSAGPESPRLRHQPQQPGNLYWSMGNHAKAEPLFRRRWRSRESTRPG